MTAHDAPIDVLITLQPVNIVQAAADLLWSPVLRKFPDLQVALSEGGIGWIPYFLDRVDWIYTRHHAWTGQDFGGQLPSEVFRERIVTCFIDDPAGVGQPRPHRTSTRCAGRATTRTRTPRGRSRPRRCGPSIRRPARRDDRQDHARERDAPLPLRPVRRTGPARSARSARCGPAPPTSTCTPRSVAARLERKTGVADLIGTADRGKRR